MAITETAILAPYLCIKSQQPIWKSGMRKLQLWLPDRRIVGTWLQWRAVRFPDSKVHGAYMGPTWGRQGPGGPHVCPMNLAIRVVAPETCPFGVYFPCYVTLKIKLVLMEYASFLFLNSYAVNGQVRLGSLVRNYFSVRTILNSTGCCK